MVQHRNRNARDIVKVLPFLSVSFMLLIVLPTQLIHNLMIFAYDPKEADKLLSEGGKVCPLESECNKQNDNQTDSHNMTLNVPNPGKLDDGQGSAASSTVNNSTGSQNETNLGNTTTLNGQIKNSIQDMINITTVKQIYNPG
jgi:hypothetical protein